MNQVFIPTVNISTGNHVGVLRIILFENGDSRADYFKGFSPTTTDFGGVIPTVSRNFTDIKSAVEIANIMIEEFPENKIAS